MTEPIIAYRKALQDILDRQEDALKTLYQVKTEEDWRNAKLKILRAVAGHLSPETRLYLFYITKFKLWKVREVITTLEDLLIEDFQDAVRTILELAREESIEYRQPSKPPVLGGREYASPVSSRREENRI